ncbi:MAG: hypothetical protein GY913_21725 [Proteobacteria bacterium]|nr:hypothetical protein [Actinomycetes bacterium]MCP4919530.1 hypothetical protein [Pseudomonadota bacterium]
MAITLTLAPERGMSFRHAVFGGVRVVKVTKRVVWLKTENGALVGLALADWHVLDQGRVDDR